jgi:prepilin-type N-terminal cleavage/methylation domain-containing protein
MSAVSTLLRRRGFTLIEALVSLVIVAFIGAIVSQALFQLARVEQLLEGGQLRSMADSVRAQWVRSAIESLLPGERGSAERLRGTANEMQGLSTDVPMLPAPGLAPLHLRLVRDDAGDQTQLQLVAPPAGLRELDPVVLLSWPGRVGRFRYLDALGEWRDEWPTAPTSGARSAALPRMIAIETGIPALRLLLAATRATEASLPTRRQLEAL